MNKKIWNTPTLTTYGSVEQLTEQINVNKIPGSGDTIAITVVGIGQVSVTNNTGNIDSIEIGSF